MRYNGPKDRLSRKYGEILSGMPVFEINKRPYPPGQHGQKRSKTSEYGTLLAEKQKLRLSYGISEKQFFRYFEQANRMKGPTGELLISLLESRLDSVVYRAGFASTMPAARQLVSHGHVYVNGKTVDIPSYHVRPQSEITLSETAKGMTVVQETLKNSPGVIEYVKVDKNNFSAQLAQFPDRNLVPLSVSERLVVEFYSR